MQSTLVHRSVSIPFALFPEHPSLVWVLLSIVHIFLRSGILYDPVADCPKCQWPGTSNFPKAGQERAMTAQRNSLYPAVSHHSIGSRQGTAMPRWLAP